MIFTDAVFLFFLPAVVAAYYIMPLSFRRYWLLISSFVFYMYWSVSYSLLLIFCIIISYAAARVIGSRTPDQNIRSDTGSSGNATTPAVVPASDNGRKNLLVLSVVLILVVLFRFKYLGFASEIVDSFCTFLHLNQRVRIPTLILPLGISFYTFTILGYLIDVYRGKIEAEKDFFNYALFVAFFPKLIQGPIERYDHLNTQFRKLEPFSTDNFADGFFLMLWGYFMKIVLADRAAIFVDSVYGMGSEAGGAAILLATIVFAFQIYGDFAGYSLIAAGSAKILGIDIMENFRAPYLAVSVGEFWKRWHISLNRWLRDYIYIPLGGNRCSKACFCRNIMITFLVSGLWHGADWTFVIWGGLNGLFVLLEDAVRGRRSVRPAIDQPQECNKARIDGAVAGNAVSAADDGRVFWKRLYTFILVDFAWLFFRAEDLGDAMDKIRRIVLFPQWSSVSAPQLYDYSLSRKNIILLALSIVFVVFCDLMQERGIVIHERIRRRFWLNKALITAGAILFLMLFGIWGSEYNAASFIYTKF